MGKKNIYPSFLSNYHIIRPLDIIRASKLVAENLIHQMGDLGLPFLFVRPGTISGTAKTIPLSIHTDSSFLSLNCLFLMNKSSSLGDSRYGCSNLGDFVNRFLQGIIQLKFAPDVDEVFDMAPGKSISYSYSYCYCLS